MNKFLCNIVVAALVILSVSACEKAPLTATESFYPEDKAFVKFALLSPNTPPVVIKIDEQKVNGASISGANSIFPSTTSSPDYLAISPKGMLKFSTTNVGTANDSIVVFTQQLNLEPRKFYSLVMADTGSRRSVFQFDDEMPIADSGFIHYRVINAIPNASLNLIRVDSASPTQVTRDTLARNIAYKSSSGFLKVALPAASSGIPIRFRIATTQGVNLFTSTPGLTNRRVTTQYASGYAGGTGVFAPTLGNLLFNR